MKSLQGLFTMLAVIICVVVLLVALNWLPSLIQKDYARQFQNVEEAKKAAGMATILMPAYFPEGIEWPPSFIVAQKKPYQALMTEFVKTSSGATFLVIVQASSPEASKQFLRIRLHDIREETGYVLRGRPATLRVGICDGTLCSEIQWTERSDYYDVVYKASPFELIKVAESMIR
ncbi:MAG TPA: hypothetical protein VK452_04470 [Dissulfurispiraceae bacterium]|nr:hypothetical protein [Dissulfurispiraceae bacterium]